MTAQKEPHLVVERSDLLLGILEDGKYAKEERLFLARVLKQAHNPFFDGIMTMLGNALMSFANADMMAFQAIEDDNKLNYKPMMLESIALREQAYCTVDEALKRAQLMLKPKLISSDSDIKDRTNIRTLFA